MRTASVQIARRERMAPLLRLCGPLTGRRLRLCARHLHSPTPDSPDLSLFSPQGSGRHLLARRRGRGGASEPALYSQAEGRLVEEESIPAREAAAAAASSQQDGDIESRRHRLTTGLEVEFLGTSSSSSTLTRNVSSLVVSYSMLPLHHRHVQANTLCTSRRHAHV